MTINELRDMYENATTITPERAKDLETLMASTPDYMLEAMTVYKIPFVNVFARNELNRRKSYDC